MCQWRYTAYILLRNQIEVSLKFRPLQPPGNISRYPSDRRHGGSQIRDGHSEYEEIFSFANIIAVLQPVARHYIEQFIPPPHLYQLVNKNLPNIFIVSVFSFHHAFMLAIRVVRSRRMRLIKHVAYFNGNTKVWFENLKGRRYFEFQVQIPGQR